MTCNTESTTDASAYYTSHTLTLPDGGWIFYTDSGVPPQSNGDHSTWIVQHGLGFNANCFKHLHALAHSKNLRLIIPNRHGYPGSSPLSPEHLQALQEGDKSVLDMFALHQAWFIESLIDSGGINTREKGGIVLVSWSIANAVTLSLFSDPTLLPQQLHTKLSQYIKSYILYDSPCLALGYPVPPFEGLYRPYADPDIPPHPKGQKYAVALNIADRISSYFDHPDPTNDIYDHSKRTERRTIKGWTEEMFKEMLDLGEGDFPLCFEPMLSTLRDQSSNALMNADVKRQLFKDVGLGYLGAIHSFPECVWGYQEVKRRYEQACESCGVDNVRKVEFRMLDYANHYVHYDYPERFLDEVLDLIQDVC